MPNQVLTLLVYLNLATLLIPIGAGTLRWSSLTASLRFAWAGLLIYFLSLSIAMAAALHYITLPANGQEYIIYATAALFGLAFALCYAVAVPPGRARWLILGLEALGLSGMVLELFASSASMPMSQWAVPAQTVINTLIPLIYLYKLTQTTVTSLLTLPLFWISLGRLISSLLSTLYDFLRVPLAESSRELLIQWMCFQFAVSILCNFTYGFGFWKARS